MAAAAVSDLYKGLSTTPTVATAVNEWIGMVFGEDDVAGVFLRADGFPLLTLPWWMATTWGVPEPGLHQDITTSSVSGYLYIRLIDNLMDGDAPGEVSLLPALHILHSRFVDPYRRRFPPQHPFWSKFESAWYQTAEVTMRDFLAREIDRVEFETISAKKTGAVRIPLAAVAMSEAHPEHLEPWYQLVDLLGCWHQMINDLFSWPRDLSSGAVTYLVSEGRRRAGEGALSTWFVDEGFSWASQQVEHYAAQVETCASGLGSSDLIAYLKQRRGLFDKKAAVVAKGLSAIGELGHAIEHTYRAADRVAPTREV